MQRGIFISLIILLSAIVAGLTYIVAENSKSKNQFNLGGSVVRTKLANHYFRISAQPSRMNFSAELDFEIDEIPGFYVHYAAAGIFSRSGYIFDTRIHCLWLFVMMIPFAIVSVRCRSQFSSRAWQTEHGSDGKPDDAAI